MYDAVAISPVSRSDPASSIRNNDHGPIRSSTEGWAYWSDATVIAVRADGLGHCAATGDAGVTGGGGGGGGRPNAGGAWLAEGVTGLATAVPPVSNFALPASTVGGLIASDTIGILPPVWKNA